MDVAAQLRDIEEIRQVKHRFLRCIDLKLWDQLGDTLTESATLDLGTSAFGTLTCHTASQPEITVDGDTATGIWSYRETVLATRHRMVIAGTGFCEECYERGADDRWRITRIGYLHSYEAMASLDDLPSFKITVGLGSELPVNGHVSVGMPAEAAPVPGRRR